MNINNDRDQDPRGSAGGFHTVHADRDPATNWAVDLNTLLEEYLAKICNGEIHGGDDFHVNFAEAALLLQGSVQVYSRKVEYLYSLVVHALEFISQQRQQDQVESTSIQPEEGTQHASPSEDDDPFWGFEDVPVEANNCLDSSSDKDASLNSFVKPPANLVVLEGDCLDTSGEAGELESYLLATTDLFRDFVLLDPCDSVAVNEYLKEDTISKRNHGGYRDSTIRKDFQSPTARSGGAYRSSAAKSRNAGANHSPVATAGIGLKFDAEGEHLGHDNEPDNEHEFHMFTKSAEPRDLDHSDGDVDDDEENDPWKPLNPYEPGNLKVKPFRKVKNSRKPGIKSSKMTSIMTRFPPARIHGTISPEFMHLWEKQCAAHDEQKGSESPPLFEKLRQTLIHGDCNPCNDSSGLEDTYRDDGYDGDVPDFTGPDAERAEDMYMDEQPGHEMHDDAFPFETDEACVQEDPTSNASLEDLCRSHLDALLASIAETETQTELAARVSSWKQKIEHNLEEQDSRPPFDIHEYGERILYKLSHEADEEKTLSFADIVQGQEKHDVARSFSALLQLVNNRDVDLDRPGAGESVCYTCKNPFHVCLLGSSRRPGEAPQRPSKKRIKSPLQRGRTKADPVNLERHEVPHNSASKLRSRDLPSQANGKFPIKLGKVGGLRCTPEGKRRRRSRYIEPVNLNSAS